MEQLQKLLELRDWYANTQFSKENAVLMQQKAKDLRDTINSITPSSEAYRLTLKLVEMDLDRWKDNYRLMAMDDWQAMFDPGITPTWMFDSCRKEIVMSLGILLNTPF